MHIKAQNTTHYAPLEAQKIPELIKVHYFKRYHKHIHVHTGHDIWPCIYPPIPSFFSAPSLHFIIIDQSIPARHAMNLIYT